MSTRILIADDHKLMRQGLRTMLARDPKLEIVGEADNGRDAINLAESLKPDVVIMDVTMPSLNGIEATRRICQENPNIKVIAVSMHPERQFIMEMLNAGASGYILKDSPIDDLMSAIETVCRGEPYLSAPVTGVLVKGCVDGSDHGFCGNLSPREREVLQMVAEGKNTKEIAYLLGLSTKTVEGHRRQVMEKLKIYSVAELTRYAIREGVTSLA